MADRIGDGDAEFFAGGAPRLVRMTLAELVVSRGPNVLDDARLVKALLSDTAPAARREINLITVALGAGVAERLRATAGDSIRMQAETDQLSSMLVRDFALRSDAAEWAVRSCAWALQLAPAPEGLERTDRPTSQPVQPATPPPPTPPPAAPAQPTPAPPTPPPTHAPPTPAASWPGAAPPAAGPVAGEPSQAGPRPFTPSVAEQRPTTPRSRVAWLAGAGAAALLLIVAVVAAILVRSHPDPSPPGTASGLAAPSTTPTPTPTAGASAILSGKQWLLIQSLPLAASEDWCVATDASTLRCTVPLDAANNVYLVYTSADNKAAADLKVENRVQDSAALAGPWLTASGATGGVQAQWVDAFSYAEFQWSFAVYDDYYVGLARWESKDQAALLAWWQKNFTRD